jgi:hypothetical protein
VNTIPAVIAMLPCRSDVAAVAESKVFTALG